MESTNRPSNVGKKMNRIFNLITMAALAVVLISQALAHSNIEMTIPNNEAILEEVPATVSIHMSKKTRLTKVEMQHEDHRIIELDISRYKGFEKEFALPIEPMGAGIYSISWRALSQDGHPIQGTFTFTVME